MVVCIEVDEAETWGKRKIPKHLALSNRNRSLVLMKTTIQLLINQK